MSEDSPDTVAALAPAPDFRYVGLEPGPRARVGLWASLLGATATLGAGLYHGVTVRGLILTAIATTAGALALRRVGGPPAGTWGATAVPMAIVPWGILVDPDGRAGSRRAQDPGQARVLRWAAIQSVRVEMLYGRDEGTPTTLWSVVTVQARGAHLAGRANGAVPLDRLLVHLEAYAHEQAHRIALDLDGEMPGEGPLEPEVEPLLGAAREWVTSARASATLDLPPAGYRSASARVASPRAIEVLGAVLRDRTPRDVDPRAFAAVVAAELGAGELVEDLVELVQSPHPMIAGVAKVAARRLGAATARVGSLDEVAPFLMEKDVEQLRAWGDARS